MEVLSEANYAMARGGCYNCTSPALGVSFDASVEGEGGLYLCKNCLFDAANLLGWEQDKGLQRSLDQTLEKLTEILEERERMDSLIQTLNKAYQLFKAREAKSGKRMDVPAGDPAGEPAVGGSLVGLAGATEGPEPGGAEPAGPSSEPEPGAVQGDAVPGSIKPVRVVPRA